MIKVFFSLCAYFEKGAPAQTLRFAALSPDLNYFSRVNALAVLGPLGSLGSSPGYGFVVNAGLLGFVCKIGHVPHLATGNGAGQSGAPTWTLARRGHGEATAVR